ncbi:MAG: TolB family protein [Janthinobacterium lividum]
MSVFPKFAAILFLFTFFLCRLHAQEFGGNPPSIHWQQINTPAARIIFPKGLDSSAQRVANIIEYMHRDIAPTIGFRQKKINIVLQNQTTISNGYVGLAPFRSEYYLTPDQNSFELGSLPWTDQLAIHEYRHVQQYNNFDVGLTKVFHSIFGEGGQAVLSTLTVPNWFYEGDAVFNETLTSRQGRGRLPFYYNGYRALWSADKNYSWMKLRNGSYQDFVPDHYPLGYMEVAYGREKYGPDFWKKVTHDAASVKTTFRGAIKKYSGLSYPQFRTQALDVFKNQFAAEDQKQARPKHFVADQEFPAFINDTSFIYVKSTYSKVHEFVLRNGMTEKVIRKRDISLDNQFSYKNGKIVYAAYRPDLRWNYKDFSSLQLLDVASGTQKTITKRSKYFSPDLSEDGKTIIAVSQSPQGKSELHLIDAATGYLISKVPNPENLVYTYPKFLNDKTAIAALRNPSGKMNLIEINLKTGSIINLTPASFKVIGFPTIKKDTVYFTAATEKNDALFALTLSDRKIYRLKNSTMNSLIGNYEATANNHAILYNSFTATGYELHQTENKDITWQPVSETELASPLSDFKISNLEKNNADLLASVPNQKFATQKYNGLVHLFNFHSIEPSFSDPDYTLALVGENILNTFQPEIFGTYNRNEGYKEIGFDAVYGALFPYLSGGVNYTFDRRALFRGQNLYWNETQIQGGFTIPLTFSNGRTFSNLSFGSNYVYNQSAYKGIFQPLLGTQAYSYLDNSVQFSSQNQKAYQQIYPSFAQNISLNYKAATTHYSANQFLANGYFYFPGIFKNNSLVLNAAYQQHSGANGISLFSNQLPFSRGYTAENLNKMDKLAANYHFPVAYPDAGLASFIYLLRIRANVFYDYTKASDVYTNGQPFKANFRSAGTEIYFDTSLWNELPFTFGFRYTRLQDNDLFGGYGPNRFELIVPLSFF